MHCLPFSDTLCNFFSLFSQSAEGGEVKIIMPSIYISNPETNFLFRWHSQIGGTFQGISWIGKIQAREIKNPISGSKVSDRKLNGYWFYSVSQMKTALRVSLSLSLIHSNEYHAVNLRKNSMLSFTVWDQFWATAPKQSHIWLILHSGFLVLEMSSNTYNLPASCWP